MKKNNSGYSVILAILMTGFMIILTSWIFLLVLGENKDTKAMEKYLKSSDAAEGSLELAMLKSKQYNYSKDDELTSSDSLAKVFYGDENKDALMTYSLEGISSQVVDKTLSNGEFDIVPLFWYDKNGAYSQVRNLLLTWLNSDVVWNIVGENSGMSGTGSFSNVTKWNYKTLQSGNIAFERKTVWDFLASSTQNYLILHNLSGNNVTYNLKSLNDGEFLTKDISHIIASGEVAWYKQNLQVNIHSSEYLNLLKYSIYSK